MPLEKENRLALITTRERVVIKGKERTFDCQRMRRERGRAPQIDMRARERVVAELAGLVVRGASDALQAETVGDALLAATAAIAALPVWL